MPQTPDNVAAAAGAGPRTLVVTDRADFFMPKLLASVALDGFEPLPIDVLRYGALRDDASPQAFTDQVPMLAWPPGVREFSADGLDAAVQPGGEPLDALLARYAQIAIYSVNPWNADLINHLVARWPQDRLSIICSDDEIERHWNYQRHAAAEPARSAERDAELRAAFLYPPAVEQAFEGMRRWFIGRAPWEAMLRTGRRSAIELIPHVPPILNRIAGLENVARGDKVYRVVLFPKPSVAREHFMAAAQTLARAAAASGLALEIVSFRNDMPTLSPVAVEGAGVSTGAPVWLRCHPYPIDEAMYHRIVAAAHGLVIVPRGGLSTIRDAVRYGLDLLSLFPNVPNEFACRDDIGLQFTPPEQLSLNGADAQARRQANRTALARYEFAAVAAFRQTYVTPASPSVTEDLQPS